MPREKRVLAVEGNWPDGPLNGIVVDLDAAVGQVDAEAIPNRDLQDYLEPVNADIGEVKVILVPEIDRDVNPAGIKGLAELGNVGTAAAVSSSVYHATGRRIRDLPVRIDDLI